MTKGKKQDIKTGDLEKGIDLPSTRIVRLKSLGEILEHVLPYNALFVFHSHFNTRLLQN